MLVKLISSFFVDNVRYRKSKEAPTQLPDEFINSLPSSAKVIEPPVGMSYDDDEGMWVLDAELLAEDMDLDDDDDDDDEMTDEQREFAAQFLAEQNAEANMKKVEAAQEAAEKTLQGMDEAAKSENGATANKKQGKNAK